MTNILFRLICHMNTIAPYPAKTRQPSKSNKYAPCSKNPKISWSDHPSLKSCKQRSSSQCPQNMSKVQMAENWERFVDLIIHHWISLWTKKLESMPPKHEASSGGWKTGLRSTSQRTAGSAGSTKERSSPSSSKPANSTTQVLSLHFLSLSFSHA